MKDLMDVLREMHKAAPNHFYNWKYDRDHEDLVRQAYEAGFRKAVDTLMSLEIVEEG